MKVYCKYIAATLIAANCAHAVIIVDGSDPENFNSIEEGIMAAVHGDTVIVRAGDYSGAGLVIDKSIVLLGEGADVTFYSSSFAAAGIEASGVVIEGFTLRANGMSMTIPGFPAIAIESDYTAVIRRNIVAGPRVTAVRVRDEAQPTLRFNRFDTRLGVSVQGTEDVDARHNWWGATDVDEIASRIEDGKDVDGRGIVAFEPWLTSPNQIFDDPATSLPSRTWGSIKPFRMESKPP